MTVQTGFEHSHSKEQETILSLQRPRSTFELQPANLDTLMVAHKTLQHRSCEETLPPLQQLRPRSTSELQHANLDDADTTKVL